VDPRPTRAGVPAADRAGWVNGCSLAYGSVCIHPRECARRQRGGARGAGTVGGAAVEVIRSQDHERRLAFMCVRVQDPALVRPGRTACPSVDTYGRARLRQGVREPRAVVRTSIVRCAERDDRVDGSVDGTGWFVLTCPSTYGRPRLRRGVREPRQAPGASAAGGCVRRQRGTTRAVGLEMHTHISRSGCALSFRIFYLGIPFFSPLALDDSSSIFVSERSCLHE
jgi:hypothetical protein